MEALRSGDASSSFKFQQSSPLDTLVRRTSSKRYKKPAALVSDAQESYGRDDIGTAYEDSAAYAYNGPTTPQKQTSHQHLVNQLSPPSPLLHSHFSRHSTATASSNGENSYMDYTRSSMLSATDSYLNQFDDDASVYSEGPAMRESWQSVSAADAANGRNSQISRVDLLYDPLNSNPNTPRRAVSPSGQDPTFGQGDAPMLVISSPSPGGDTLPPRPVSKPGRAPIVSAQVTANFSRPVRPPTLPPPSTEEQKRLVLERNAARARSPSNASQRSLPSSSFQPQPPLPSRPSTSSDNPYINPYMGNKNSSRSHAGHAAQTNEQERSISPHSMRAPSPNAPSMNPAASLRSVNSVPDMASRAAPSNVSSHPTALMPGRQNNRSGSPTSVYSGYSFYQLPPSSSNDLASPSPPQSTSSPPQPPLAPPTITVTPSPQPPPEAAAAPLDLKNPKTPQEFLQLGIQSHEANKLGESAEYFEKAAKLDGGCGVGMLMYGLTLRHGWGCAKNEKVGFKWLRKAAESAVEDLESARANSTMDVGAVQSELVLAIYEVGQCFFQGWGVAKDQKMAVSYYRVAARLGDPDAQNDLGFCLANGRGCKKDRKEAAKWYRAAVAQGASDVGLAWIYKEKFR